jgi:hypothetical protein
MDETEPRTPCTARERDIADGGVGRRHVQPVDGAPSVVAVAEPGACAQRAERA